MVSPADVRGRGGMSNFRKTPGPHKPLASFGILHEKRDPKQQWSTLKNAVASGSLLQTAVGAAKGANELSHQAATEALTGFATVISLENAILVLDANTS
eukprot:scaffold165774_cov34-Prasinocladus_malaysianus.AAC.1